MNADRRAGGRNVHDGRDEDEVTDPVWIVRQSMSGTEWSPERDWRNIPLVPGAPSRLLEVF